MKKFEKIYPANLGANITLKLMAGRLGNLDVPPKYYPDTVDNANLMASELVQRGGLPQQERMVRDKRKSLDKATLYSYQAARIKKVQGKDLSNKGLEGEAIVRALINPDKNKFDYDPYTPEKAVTKYNDAGEFLESYTSIKEAAIANNIKTRENINAAISGRQKRCGGFRWRYFYGNTENIKPL